MKISACLIVKNEENNIARCIESFKEFVDEIIVVDTGSSDKSVDIAKKMGARVYYFKWDNNFANARNYAIKKVKGDWIIFLDADEYFYGGTGRNLRIVLQTVSPDTDALLCKCFDIGENGQVFYSDNRTRIFRNNSRIRYKGRIHENLNKEGDKLLLEIVHENYIKIYHTGYLSDEILEQKYRRNINILLSELKQEGCNPRIHSYLLDTYLGLKDYDSAIKHGRLFLDSGYSKGLDAQVRYNLIRAMMSAGTKPQDIFSEINIALDKYPNHPDLHWLLAKFLMVEKKYDDALTSFLKTIECGFSYNGIEGTRWPFYQAEAYYHIDMIYEMQNEFEQAESFYIKSLRHDKFNSTSLSRLLTLRKMGEPEDTIHKLQSIYNDKNKEEVRFLLNFLGKLRVKSVLKRYYNLWRRNFGQDDITLLFVLLTESKYEEAFNYFFDIYRNEKNEKVAVFTAVAALLSGNDIYLEKVRSVVDASLRKILDSYRNEQEETLLGEKEFTLYMGLLNELTYLSAEQHINRLLRMKNRFDTDKIPVLSEFFMSLGKYDRALEQLYDMEQGCSDLAQLYFKTGLCYYKNCNYQKAAESMEKALRHGYSCNDIFEFLRWIAKRVEGSITGWQQ